MDTVSLSRVLEIIKVRQKRKAREFVYFALYSPLFLLRPFMFLFSQTLVQKIKNGIEKEENTCLARY